MNALRGGIDRYRDHVGCGLECATAFETRWVWPTQRHSRCARAAQWISERVRTGANVAGSSMQKVVGPSPIIRFRERPVLCPRFLDIQRAAG